MANGVGGARASDAERQKVIELLRHHTGVGRLTLDEFADRAGDVYAALTREELAQVVVDLPEGVRPEVGPAAATAAPAFAATPATGTGATGPRRRRFLAIMGHAENRGRWRAPEEMTAFSFWGGVDLDLRNALIDSPVIEIRAWAIMGSVEVVVPPGIPVEMHGFVLMGGANNRVRSEEPIPGAPVVRIRARGLWGAVVARNPSKRRRHGDRRGDRRERRSQIHADVHRLVDDALGMARDRVERALTTGSVSDRIPETGTAQASATTKAGAGTNASTADSTPEPTPTPSAAAPTPGDATGPDGAAGADGTGPARAGRIPTGTLTILVSDIADSTRMTERYGDQDWIEILQTHNAIVRRQVAGHGGTEVKAQGDGFLVVFPSAREAVLAAIGVQQAMSDYRREHPDVPLDLRLGLHTGEVVATDDDVFGHNVAVASRIADTAAPGEIVVSGLTRDLTASASDLGYDDGTDVSLKGVSRPWRVHRVRWS